MGGPEQSNADRELEAIGTVLRALEALDGESIERVLEYVFSRLSLRRPSGLTHLSSGITASGNVETLSPLTLAEQLAPKRQVSILDLKEEKQPSSSNQMAALVAYYFAEVAPEADRKLAIGVADIEKGFKHARFRMPQRIQMTLVNAARAGYLDSVGNGLYKLNPVGYNLVAYGLPSGASGRPVKKKKKPAKRGSQR